MSLETLQHELATLRRNFAEQVRSVLARHVNILVAETNVLDGNVDVLPPEIVDISPAPSTKKSSKAAAKRDRTPKAVMAERELAACEYAKCVGWFSVKDFAKYVGLDPRDAALTLRKLAKTEQFDTQGSRGSTKYRLAGGTLSNGVTTATEVSA